jgi:tetratricopeptide (TPR) repeat protein
MRLLRSCLFFTLLFAGPYPMLTAGPGDEALASASLLWRRGQEAMKAGHTDDAIDLYLRSLHADAAYSSSHLSLAAAFMEKQQLPDALVHLGLYIDANPEQTAVRVRYAELLLRLKRTKDAACQFERAIADAQEKGDYSAQDLVLCHSRLVSISEDSNDSYAEHLHRGIGLFLLANRRGALPDPDGALPQQGLLIKSAAELTHARLERGREAQPCWYLYLVWSQLGQRQPAQCRLRQAADLAPFSLLTPTERRDLEWAIARGLRN